VLHEGARTTSSFLVIALRLFTVLAAYCISAVVAALATAPGLGVGASELAAWVHQEADAPQATAAPSPQEDERLPSLEEDNEAAEPAPDPANPRGPSINSADARGSLREDNGAPTGVLAGIGALAGNFGTYLAVVALTYVLGLIPVANVLGYLCFLCFGPAIMGTGGGLAAWAVAWLAGNKRVPILPLVISAIGGLYAGMCGYIVCGGLGLGAGLTAYVTGFLLGTWQGALIAMGGVAAAFAAVALGMMVFMTGCAGGSAGAGVLAAMLGRPLVSGEDGWNFDLIAVPPPGVADDADDVGEEELETEADE
jgi:hypothetical protein